MAYEEKAKPAKAHSIILEGRAKLAVSGVEEVESFDENEIVMSTCEGTLIVTGERLHIDKLTLDGGELHVDGHVESMSYVNESPHGGFLSRIFR